MGEQLQKVLKSFRQFWDAQERKRKIIYISILAAVILLAIIITIILNRKDYVVLYEGLETAEASTIAAEIQNLGYEASLKSGGTITVLKGTENQLAMEMAMIGYPKGSGSLDYKDYTEKVGMFTTESEKKTYLKIAEESRLGAIISGLNGVESAVVNLTIPEQKNTVIQALRQEPTAAVKVNLERGVTLTNEQITGITNLVSFSVAGLKEENVTIIDGYGIPQIAGENSVDVIADMTRKFYFRTQLENALKNKVLDLLVPGYDEDMVAVAVAMDINFDSKASELTDYQAEPNTNTGVLQHADGSNAAGGTTADGGVVGVEGNADDTFPTGDTAGNGNWNEESFSNTYLVDTYKEQIIKDGYSIDALSISVVIYDEYLAPTLKQEFVSMIANAVGIRTELAGDLVSVVSFEKASERAAVVDEKPDVVFGLNLEQLLVIGAALVILLIILFVLVALSNRSIKKKREKFEKHIIEATNVNLDELPRDIIADGFTINADGQAIEVPSLTDDTIETKEVVIRREISEFAKTSPDIVAQLLKNWIKEDDE